MSESEVRLDNLLDKVTEKIQEYWQKKAEDFAKKAKAESERDLKLMIMYYMHNDMTVQEICRINGITQKQLWDRFKKYGLQPRPWSRRPLYYVPE